LTRSSAPWATGGPDALRPRRIAGLIDPGAVAAAFVGIGMAVTIGISFLLVIPIEPVYWAMSAPAGLLIGYYANTRARRGRGEWLPILSNGLFSGLATGLTLAALLLAVKGLFFFADNGYRDAGASLTCSPGAECVYKRYLEDQGDALRGAGITDAASFSSYYWAQQWQTAGLLVAVATGFGVLGAGLYGATRPKPGAASVGTAA
jgi:hypothetical protein